MTWICNLSKVQILTMSRQPKQGHFFGNMTVRGREFEVGKFEATYSRSGKLVVLKVGGKDNWWSTQLVPNKLEVQQLVVRKFVAIQFLIFSCDIIRDVKNFKIRIVVIG